MIRQLRTVKSIRILCTLRVRVYIIVFRMRRKINIILRRVRKLYFWPVTVSHFVAKKLHLQQIVSRLAGQTKRGLSAFMVLVLLLSILPVFLLSGLFVPKAAAASMGPRYATATGDCVSDSSNGGTVA